ncbi:hypothetical protein GH714_035461 [Hevea brasiliensis]|uniref:Uncharacterized protein n=1 Tax=Hevea brasiliensis TaxID=3981 RepID=A0A6A6NEF1_HEVBR|nr:hypothetical protein GH714_035461 [Hevea brasiliensis]
MASSASAEETNGDNSAAVAKADNNEMEFSRVNCLLWVLHESAASFSLAVQSLELPGRNAELAMAWNGKDVHEWHKRISYQVAVFPLLKMAIEVEMLLSLDRHNNGSPVKEILTPKINLVGECIESQLKMQHPALVQWFRVVELPRIVQAGSLATLGFFAFLGRNTRLFLSRMNVKDLDVFKDFLNYLECGILFIHPELATVSAYACFVELVTEEIGWLDFYATCFPLSNQERKRSKQHPIQAEKEIILSTVFTVGYDVFSGFAHFGHATQQPLDAKSLEFLLQSQSLLTVCLEDYRAVCARTSEFRKIAEAVPLITPCP